HLREYVQGRFHLRFHRESADVMCIPRHKLRPECDISSLLQRRYARQRAVRLRNLPSAAQFIRVKPLPLCNKSEDPSRQLTRQNSTIFYVYRSFKFPVNRMKMRHSVLAIKHCYHDSEKSAELRHLN